jgi:hypothetical protein
MKEKKVGGVDVQETFMRSAWEFWTEKKEETGVNAQNIGSAKCLGVLNT